MLKTNFTDGRPLLKEIGFNFDEPLKWVYVEIKGMSMQELHDGRKN